MRWAVSTSAAAETKLRKTLPAKPPELGKACPSTLCSRWQHASPKRPTEVLPTPGSIPSRSRAPRCRHRAPGTAPPLTRARTVVGVSVIRAAPGRSNGDRDRPNSTARDNGCVRVARADRRGDAARGVDGHRSATGSAPPPTPIRHAGQSKRVGTRRGRSTRPNDGSVSSWLSATMSALDRNARSAAARTPAVLVSLMRRR